MPLEVTILLIACVLVLLLSLLKVEKLVKLTFGSYVLLVLILAVGSLFLQGAEALNASADTSFLGISGASLATFLLSAQPTAMVVILAGGLWFFAQNSHLSITLSAELFEKKLQTLLWGLLSLMSSFAVLYFALAYFKGPVYDRLFTQSFVAAYQQWIPLMAFCAPLITLIAASHINLRFSFKKES